MKPTTIALCALLAWFVLDACADDVYVIVNPGTQMSAADTKEIFSGERQFIGPLKLIPVENVSVQADFLSKVFHLSLDRYNALWMKKSFRDGINPPAVKLSDEDVIVFVKSTPGAVGYVRKSSPHVKVIEKY